MSHVTIHLSTMGFHVAVGKKGELTGTHLSIAEYARKFEQWDRNKDTGVWTLVSEFYHFDPDRGVCYFPRYDLVNFKTFLTNNGITSSEVTLTPCEGAPESFLMLPHIEYKSDIQKNAIEYLSDPNNGPVRGLGLQTGQGKAQPLDSLVRTPTGWVRMGDITVGNKVVAPDGTVSTVTGVFPQGEKSVCKVTFEDGRSTECCDEHLWKVHYVQWKDKWRVLPLYRIAEYLNSNPTYTNRMYVPLIEPEINENVNLPLDPYVLGALIGDGYLSTKRVGFSTADSFMIEEMSRLLPNDVKFVRLSDYDYGIRRVEQCLDNYDNDARKTNSVLNELRNLGLAGSYSDTKFIPDIYMNASSSQKLSLLQGLMDTDGTVGKVNPPSFSTVSKTLAIQVQELVRSLGGLAKISERYTNYTYLGEKKTGKLAYRVNIRYKEASDLFRLPRKKDLCPQDYQYKDCLKLRIRTIEYIGKKQTQCIMIDHPEHLYITDDYIVTHNTISYVWALQKLGVRSMTTMTTRLDQWVRELTSKTTLESDDIFIIAGVASLTKLFAQIDTIKPKLILASAQTIRRYIDYAPSYQHLPHPSEMCEKLGIGVIGTDEYHEHFFTNYLIGIMMNPAVFIPITATFLASDPFTKNIFDQFIPKTIQFSGGEYKKYVNITACTYNGGIGAIKPFHYMSPKGYSQVIFEKNLLARLRKVFDRILEEAILPMIRDYYIRIAVPGEKFLFLCATKNMCDHLANVFTRAFPDKKVIAFHSGMSEKVLEQNDMIISTPGSAGTGRDIANLRTCFAFESSYSEIRNLQFLGRLRDFPSVKNTPEFIYLKLGAVPPHTNHSIQRSMLYGPRALQLKHRTLS